MTVRLWFSVESGEAHLGLGEREMTDEEEEASGRAHLLVWRRLRRDEFGVRRLPQPPEQRRPAAVAAAVVLVRGAAGAARRGGANLGGGDHGHDRRAGIIGRRRWLLLPVGAPRAEEPEHGLLDLLPFLRPPLGSFLVCQGRLQPAVLLGKELDLSTQPLRLHRPARVPAHPPLFGWRRCPVAAAAALPTEQLLHRPSHLLAQLIGKLVGRRVDLERRRLERVGGGPHSHAAARERVAVATLLVMCGRRLGLGGALHLDAASKRVLL